MGKTVAFATLGCKVNQYDTEAMMRFFRLSGYSVVSFEERADVYVVDTCSVTGRAASQSRQVIRQAARRQPEAVVVAAGCYPQTAPGAVLAMPEVSVVLGNRDRDRVVELVEEALDARALGQFAGPLNAVAPIAQLQTFQETPIDQFSGRTRAPLKVQDGCGMFCTYCIIPYARGPSRSRQPDLVVAEAERLVQAGFKEVVLNGIHLGSYGQDLDGVTLIGVLRRLHDIQGLERIRLSSLEPMHVTPELVEALAEWPKLCPHLHLSLQSGSDPVLRRMKRSYTSGEYRSVVEALRQRLPDLGLSTDVMVGFPGETEQLFEETCRFVEALAFPGCMSSATRPARARRQLPWAGRCQTLLSRPEPIAWVRWASVWPSPLPAASPAGRWRSWWKRRARRRAFWRGTRPSTCGWSSPARTV